MGYILLLAKLLASQQVPADRTAHNKRP